MALFKCKMCGGALEINNKETVATCEYCGTQQTLPKLDDDKRANMYDRANHFRRNNEFDKATGIYEQILNEDNTDAEAYWSLVLCRYGIEYVEDPSSHKRIPTVNRAQYTSIFDDDNYKSALQYADGYQKSIYEEEAKAINEIQKGILAISQKEDPFDVFICYKETDSNGRRTPDSVLANDLYHQLTQEGFKVFFARITLEDKLGSAYEPYIFAALNSAKVMVVLGTKPAFFNAVWVKNEWSRYLALIKQGQKKMLIPAYKDMDPYDLPEEFSHLQAQDMTKLGFMQDLIRGIKKIAKSDEQKTTVVKETVVTNASANTAPLIKRVFMFLEDSKWSEANEYCEKVLDVDPECAEAYLGKLLAGLKVQRKTSLEFYSRPFDHTDNYDKIVRFGSEALVNELKQYNITIRERNEENRKEAIYAEALDAMKKADISSIEGAIKKFQSIVAWKNSEEKIEECNKKITSIKQQQAQAIIEQEKRKKKFTIGIVIALLLISITIGLSVSTYKTKLEERLEVFCGFELGDPLSSWYNAGGHGGIDIAMDEVNGTSYARSSDGQTIDSLYWISDNSNGNKQEIVDTARERIINHLTKKYGEGKEVIVPEGILWQEEAQHATQFITKSGIVYLVGPDSKYNIFVVQVENPY